MILISVEPFQKTNDELDFGVTKNHKTGDHFLSLIYLINVPTYMISI